MATKHFSFPDEAGLTATLEIRRKSDNFYWTGSAWQSGSATVALTETASYSDGYSEYSSTTAPTAPCWWKALDASNVLRARGEFTGTGLSVDSTAGSWPPSLADVHTYLHLKTATTGDDTLLDLIRVKAKDAIEEYCGSRLFASASRTFYLSGNGTTLLPVPQYPITAITSVVEDISVPRDWTVTAVDSNYYLIANDSADMDDESKNKIVRISGAWPGGVENIRVIATVGYSTIPNNLYQGCMELIMHMFFRAKKKNIGVTTRSEAGGSEGYDLEKGLMPSVVKGLIDPFRTVEALGFG